jgi:hypothetical protein
MVGMVARPQQWVRMRGGDEAQETVLKGRRATQAMFAILCAFLQCFHGI